MDGSRRDGTESKNSFDPSESCSSALVQFAGDILIDTQKTKQKHVKAVFNAGIKESYKEENMTIEFYKVSSKMYHQILI